MHVLFRSNHWRHSALWVPVILISIMFTLYFSAAADALAYDYERLFSEPWRILGAHFVHLNFAHLISNLLAFIAVCLIFAPVMQGRVLLNVVLFSALFAALVPYLLGEQAQFAGFSGVIHGLISFATCQMALQKRKAGYVMLALLALKLCAEWFLPLPTSIWLGADIAPAAHLGGAVGGLVAVIALRPRLQAGK